MFIKFDSNPLKSQTPSIPCPSPSVCIGCHGWNPWECDLPILHHSFHHHHFQPVHLHVIVKWLKMNLNLYSRSFVSTSVVDVPPSFCSQRPRLHRPRFQAVHHHHPQSWSRTLVSVAVVEEGAENRSPKSKTGIYIICKAYQTHKASCFVEVVTLVSPARLAITTIAMKLLVWEWHNAVNCCKRYCNLCKLRTPWVVMLKIPTIISWFSLLTPAFRPLSVAANHGWRRASSFPDTSTSPPVAPEFGASLILEITHDGNYGETRTVILTVTPTNNARRKI